FSSRRRHTRSYGDWSSDVCSSDLPGEIKDILLREIEAADLHELDVEEVGTILEVKDGIARIYGLKKAMAGEMLEITASESGDKRSEERRVGKEGRCGCGGCK